MYDIDKLEKFLLSIEDFYKAKPGKEKSGIGHEIEHINGVTIRAKEYAEIVNGHKKEYKINENVDFGVVAISAALHDIGNVIERDGHNHYGYGIVKGKLSISDILDVPFFNPKTRQYMDKTEKMLFRKATELNGYCIDMYDSNNFPLALRAISTQMFFELAYFDTKINTEEDLRNHLEEHYTNISKDLEDALVKNLTRNGKVTVRYNSKLSKITEQIQEIFDKDEKTLNLIAEAIQDHNVDYENQIQRYQSRSIYGKIVSDADKDGSPEVFALRTIMYAINKMGRQQHNKYCLIKNPSEEEKAYWNSDFVPDLKHCAMHVVTQSWERFRESATEYTKRTGKSGSQRRVFEDLAEIKKNLIGVKGIENPITIPCPKTKEEIDDIVKEKNYIIDSNHNLIVFSISPNEGEDLASELDALSRNNRIRDARKDFIETVRRWGDIDNLNQSLKEIAGLILEYANAKSNEEIIGTYEAKHCKEIENGEMKNYSYSEIVKCTLMRERKNRTAERLLPKKSIMPTPKPKMEQRGDDDDLGL